ncbi:hypothetical protein DM02DRAFT_90901 [Periconia macrospinosa]|uniref:Uncharacterized protein n=1 Tax=Periconia macrospinosa TaxID=97972 RepID=A0A2V1DHT4_9PLEO|nr:hypothetical protein DM02DRAFT_90901 [Periconia macrospinosa]
MEKECRVVTGPPPKKSPRRHVTSGKRTQAQYCTYVKPLIQFRSKDSPPTDSDPRLAGRSDDNNYSRC